MATSNNDNNESYIEKVNTIITDLASHLLSGPLEIKSASMATGIIHSILVCDRQEIPRIIGKNGQTINAMRTILHASVAKDGIKTYIFISE